MREIVSAALAEPQRRGTPGDLKKLAADIRKLSAGRRQTVSEDLLRRSRRTVTWVVDAGVAAEWLVPEVDSPQAEALLDDDLIAPDLLFPECAWSAPTSGWWRSAVRRSAPE